MAQNLIDGLQAELKRCDELLKAYKEIGPAGLFASQMLSKELEGAREAMADGDCVQMLKSLAALRECN